MATAPHKPITEIESVEALLAAGNDLSRCVIQGLDLSRVQGHWADARVERTVFLGCRFADEHLPLELQRRGAYVFPALPGLPYHPYRNALYTWQELMEGYDEVDDRSLDRRIYDHTQAGREAGPDILESLARRIHDHAIDDALGDLLHGHGERKTLAIMGGHGTPRTDPFYRKVVEIARALTRSGYFVASGGGPGIMEAANLGAYLAPHPDTELDAALDALAPNPRYTDAGYISCARQVLKRLPTGGESLAIPTWFYGHEPSNLFGSHIAKYFANSIREDGLLAIALHGVLYAPGSAGTLQEVFMDACQNHYATFRFISPMVFLGRDRYQERSGLYAMLQREAAGRPYAESIHLTDDPADAVAFFQSHPPRIHA